MITLLHAGWVVTGGFIKEVSRYCSPKVEYLMISCRLHYLPKEFSSILFVTIYLPPQTDAGTDTALNQLYKAKRKQENAHPEVALLVARDFKNPAIPSDKPSNKQSINKGLRLNPTTPALMLVGGGRA